MAADHELQSGGHVGGVEDMLSAQARAAVDACAVASAVAHGERLAELAARWAAEAGGQTVDTLAVRLIHARTVAETGDLPLCRELLHELTEETSRLLGPDHPLSVAARQVAAAHGAGRVDSALDDDTRPSDDPDPDSAPASAQVFTSLEEFVSDYIAVIFPIDPSRDVHAWCPDWWRHPEAVVRLSAMWEAFESRSADDPATGLERWYRDADLHLHELRHPVSGPFARCSPTDGHTAAAPALPTRPAPSGVLRRPEFCVNADGTDDTPDGHRLVFESLEEFVVLYIAAVFPSGPDDLRQAWCPEWWRHGQAVARFATLWRSYEYHHAFGLISDWLLNSADPQMSSLRAPISGPFSRCSATLGHDEAHIPMPVNPPPTGFTYDERGTPLLMPPGI